MIAPDVSERDFQRAVIDLAHTFHWRVAHFRTAVNPQRGNYMTPVGADGAGWPDLVLVHPGSGRILFRELKSRSGRITAGQTRWGEWLTACRLDWKVWRPADMPEIARTLAEPTGTTIVVADRGTLDLGLDR